MSFNKGEVHHIGNINCPGCGHGLNALAVMVGDDCPDQPGAELMPNIHYNICGYCCSLMLVTIKNELIDTVRLATPGDLELLKTISPVLYKQVQDALTEAGRISAGLHVQEAIRKQKNPSAN